MLTGMLILGALLIALPLAAMAMRRENGKRLTLRRYAFIPILFGAMALFIVGFWHFEREVAVHDAKNHAEIVYQDENRWPEVWEEEEFRDQFWAGVFENDQSEMFQLGVEGVMLIALGRWIAYKDQEDLDEIKQELAKIKEMIARRE